MKIGVEEFLDKTLTNFFPQTGIWYGHCYNRPKSLEDLNMPCNLRDDDWLADLILKKYDLDSLSKEDVLEYISTSEIFNKSRYEYEQKIVSWQIDWMNNGGDGWIVDKESGGSLYIFGPNCEEVFRKGIVDTLLAIGMNIDAIEEGIEKNVEKWREGRMKTSFRNMYVRTPYSIVEDKDIAKLEEPSQAFYEKWRKFRLFQYYIEHKASVDKYGVILPEMHMSESEAIELRLWLEAAHNERMLEIKECKARQEQALELKKQELQSSEEKSQEVDKTTKSKSLLKRLFRK